MLTSYGIDPNEVKVNIEPASRWGNWLGAVGFLLPTLFLIAIFVFMMRQAQGSNNQAISFGRAGRGSSPGTNRP
jgi:cell division protease FtsH